MKALKFIGKSMAYVLVGTIACYACMFLGVFGFILVTS